MGLIVDSMTRVLWVDLDLVGCMFTSAYYSPMARPGSHDSAECAMLKWLGDIGVPAPKLHGYGLRNDKENAVGVAFMLIDELPGKPLLHLSPTKAQLEKVHSDFARKIDVGHIIGDRTGTLPPVGPFSNAREGKFNCFEKELKNGPFFLKHMDDKGDHILVDEKFNIVGIIDWTFARAVPVYEDFGLSLLTADMGSIYGGREGASDRDKLLARSLESKNGQLTRFANSPDSIRRLTFTLGMGMNLAWSEALDLVQGIVISIGDCNDNFRWGEWRTRHIDLMTGDDVFAFLEKQSKTSSDVYSPSLNNAEVSRFATCSVLIAEGHLFVDKAVRYANGTFASSINPRCFMFALQWLDDEAWEKAINDEVSGLLVQMNVAELVNQASALNSGKLCVFKPGKHLGPGSLMGCANYHGLLSFEDGEEWLVRIPRTGFTDIPIELIDYFVTSEYATLKFLESTKIPSPKTHGLGITSDPKNTVGVNYVLIQKLPGKPYYQYSATPEQITHVLRRVADIVIELNCHPFRKVGSLLCQDGNISVSPIASNRCIHLGKHGPFSNAVDYFTSIAEQYLDLISTGQVHTTYPKEAFLFYDVLRQLTGDHILVDDDYNITGIIDWQFARCVPE
ncbi:hypothetical protein AJ80_09873 [Polytolypa hystricis UAMH7299]|uniref:Aminoglycoside phosphotransferase domain-containing protein n=1 Tax=Polytolypa hystricis (strain UAMH7299) TaxID=1447883 RepID=A0A2B7WH65_POLH7|nr:hypothetical protein AJ80_09873 [Polytolypa hystricis UAMH7299]